MHLFHRSAAAETAGLACAILISLILMLAPRPAHAVCGDVSGDDDIEASDALRVLRAAVGQPVDLVCTADPLRHSELRLYNAFNCSSGSDKAVLETDEGQDFSANNFDSYSDYQVLGTGTIEGFNYKQCNQNIRFDGPFKIAPERKLYVYAVAGDPDFYGAGTFFLVMRDEGPRAGAPPSESLVTDEQSMGVLGRAIESGTEPRVSSLPAQRKRAQRRTRS